MLRFFYYSLIACGLFVLLSRAQARAQDAATSGQGTYGQLAALSNQIAILKAQAQIAQLEAEIQATKRNANAPASGGGSYDSAGRGLPAPPAMTDDEPRVLSITGRGRRLSALLLMAGGGEIEAVPGTWLGNGAVVQVVSPMAVEVMQDGKLMTLPFAGTFKPGG